MCVCVSCHSPLMLDETLGNRRGLVSRVGVCVSCHFPLMLDETLGNRRGLVSRVSITCSNSSCKKSVLLSDPSSSEDNCLNDAAILGTVMASCGYNALQELSAGVGMRPLLSRPMGQNTIK